VFKSILLAYDGSEHARKAAQIAGDLAREQSDHPRLWVVAIMEAAPWELGEPYLSQFIEQRTRSGQALLDAAAVVIGARVEIHSELLFGTPAECIIEVAETRACDLIVMGTRGLGALRGLLLGSQAQKVVSHAHCPVLLVK